MPDTDTYRFTDRDGDVATVQPVTDDDGDPAVWLQTYGSGCYITTVQLAEFIDGLQGQAMAAAHAAGKDCLIGSCGPCSFDRALASKEN